MSFDKNYPNRKDKRQPFRKAKAIDRTCRNHGSCKYCENKRIFFDFKERSKAENDIKEYKLCEK